MSRPATRALVDEMRDILRVNGRLRVDTLAYWMGVGRRAVHYALNESLDDSGDPIITAGDGCVLLSHSTPEERDHAAAKLFAMAHSLLRRARKTAGKPVPSEPHQLKLFDESGERWL